MVKKFLKILHLIQKNKYFIQKILVQLQIFNLL